MARHVDPVSDPYPGYPARPPQRRPRRRAAWVAGAAAAVVLVAFCVPAVLPDVLPGVRSALPWFPPAPCHATTVVEIVAVPVVEPALTSVTRDTRDRRLSDGSCLAVRVRAQAPADTVASSTVLPAARAPQLWVGDSSLWTPRITRWRTRTTGSFASTPVVVASSRQSLDAKGWAGAQPTWAQALGAVGEGTSLVVPDLAGDAGSQLAMLALWQSAGKGATADRAVAAAVLAARRSPYPTEADALSGIINPPEGTTDVQAPLVTSTEQAVVTFNRDSSRPVLAAVYPQDGSPVMDFPVVRLAEDAQDGVHREATDVVAALLASPQARAAARALGLRAPGGGDPPTATKPLPATVRAMAAPAAAELARFSSRFTALSVPSRMLVVVDVSRSMGAGVPGAGMTRLQLAGRAAAGVGDLLPGASPVGLWAFAQGLDGDRPYQEISPVRRLELAEAGVTHRQVVQKQLLGLGGLLTGTDAELFRTALDALRATRASYDPRTSNTVVLFTAGKGATGQGLSLDGFVRAAAADAQAAPDRPVRLVCIGLGADADVSTLEAMARATPGGAAYRAESPDQLQSVLYDAIARRT